MAEGHNQARGSDLVRAVARGAALFFGTFSLANALVALRTGRTEDLWWIDMSGLPSWVTAVAWLGAGLLVWYAVAPAMSDARRKATASASALLAIVALWNAGRFYMTMGHGFVPAVPVPFSALIAAVFAFVGVAVWRAPRASGGWAEVAGVIVAALVLAAAFPLAHVWFFGTSDYRRPADIAVVLGARVYPDGTLSVSLEDRVRTACELYREGLVGRLVMSGGVGESGYDETLAMRERAIELGVPESAITRDPGGVDTDHTAADTARMFEATGASKILVVSQFYHLPRIKMAYRAVGWNVYTVPAERSLPIAQTPMLVIREIPGFWVYWGRAWIRAMAGG